MDGYMDDKMPVPNTILGQNAQDISDVNTVIAFMDKILYLKIWVQTIHPRTCRGLLNLNLWLTHLQLESYLLP